MRINRLVFLLALALAGCTPRAHCIELGALTGAVVLGGAASGVAIGLDCGPRCVEQKIRQGESIHESVTHHVNRRNDEILYGALPGAALGALGGGLIAAHYCKDE